MSEDSFNKNSSKNTPHDIAVDCSKRLAALCKYLVHATRVETKQPLTNSRMSLKKTFTFGF